VFSELETTIVKGGMYTSLMRELWTSIEA
jgi:hypothetical protein